MTAARKIRIGVSWVLQVLLGLAFVAVGIAKFNNAWWIRSFEHWGYAPWFRIAIGIVEVGGGLLLFIPRFTTWSAIGLAIVMVGASVTHATHDGFWAQPLPHFALLLLLAWLRWPNRWRRRAALPAGVIERS